VDKTAFCFMQGGGWLRLGNAVHPRNRSLFDLVNRHNPRSEEADHDVDPAGNTAITVLPTSDAARANAKQLRNTLLRNAESIECQVKFCRGHGARQHMPTTSLIARPLLEDP
jgi:hypothetical protein